MYKKTASVLILSTILLAACSKEEPKAALDCAQPATLQNIRATIEDTLKQQARSFARNDNTTAKPSAVPTSKSAFPTPSSRRP